MCNDENNEQPVEQNKEVSSVESMGSTVTKSKKGVIHCLTIIGQIEGHMVLPPQNKSTKYEHVLPTLVAVDESEEIDGLLILLNTSGGDVEAGLAIAEMIATMKKPTVSLVLGGGHSIGVPLAVASEYSFIAPTATMTIHPIRMNGLVIGVPQTLNYFEKIQDRIINFVTLNSKMKSETFRKFCFNTMELATDVGSMLDGKEAVENGLINELGGLKHATDKLYQMIKERKEAQESVEKMEMRKKRRKRELRENRGDKSRRKV